MSPRDNIPKHIPCYVCLTLAMCMGKTIHHLFETCPILQDWYIEREKKDEMSVQKLYPYTDM